MALSVVAGIVVQERLGRGGEVPVVGRGEAMADQAWNRDGRG